MLLKVNSLLVQNSSLRVAVSTSYWNVPICCPIGANHRAVLPWHLSSLPDILQPRGEGQSLHGRGPVEKTGKGGQTFQTCDTKGQHQGVLQGGSLSGKTPTHTCADFAYANVFISQNGAEHAHAFINSPEACHFCDVEQNLNGKANTPLKITFKHLLGKKKKKKKSVKRKQ